MINYRVSDIRLYLIYGLILIKCDYNQSQIPAFGGCPSYQAMPGFISDRFLGKWYEVEKYFNVNELVSKCIAVTYERRLDDQIWVNNEFTNRYSGVVRIISGTMSMTGKGGEGKYLIKYSSLPFRFETPITVLDTDYNSFAVLWSCNSVGPLGHTESVWVLAREREPSTSVMQRIYGILDRYHILRSFFVKTDQMYCDTLPPPHDSTRHPLDIETITRKNLNINCGNGDEIDQKFIRSMECEDNENNGTENDVNQFKTNATDFSRTNKMGKLIKI